MSEQSVREDSRYRVAFDLMQTIANSESKDKVGKPDPRTYYLKLYYQCMQATFPGNSLNAILPKD